MILGIDFGISTTDIAIVKKNKIVKAFHIETGTNLASALHKKGIDVNKVNGIAVTGGNHSLKKVLGKKFSKVEEINAIGFGGASLSKTKSALVVSMGTGTCIVSFKNGKATHVGGTGLGGGTVLGLSKRLVGTANIKSLSKLALEGKKEKIDLSVKEAIGSGIGLVPGSATASNFAKSGGSRKDIAFGVQEMVAEANAVMVALAAKQTGHKKIVFIGKTPAFPVVKKALKRVLEYYNLSAEFPKHSEHATAIGAANWLAKQ